MLGSDTRRRLDAVESRLAWLDEHGTRGVDSIRGQITEQAKDIGTIESRLGEMNKKLDGISHGRTATFAAFALAIIPVYVLLLLVVTHAKGY